MYPRRCRLLPLLSAALVLAATPVCGARVSDLLDPEKLTKLLKATSEQRSLIDSLAAELESVVADFHLERGRMTCEAALWQGKVPRVQVLHDMRKDARRRADAILDTLRSALEPGQAARIDKLLRRKESILDVQVRELPFHHINNTPLFNRFRSTGEAYRVSFPVAEDAVAALAYRKLLGTWTVRGYIPFQRPIDRISPGPGISQYPHMRVEELPAPVRRQLVRSPLLLAATLMAPDLCRSELDLLWEHYDREGETREEMWSRYRDQNRLGETILIRVKMGTPYAREYLDLSRWIIYLEDGEGAAYEPLEASEEVLHSLEALEISVPGREAEITDMFGEYYPYVPGHKESIVLEAPAKVTYTGTEKLVKLHFPAIDILGRPVVTEETRYLKLILQSQAEDFSRTELTWDLRRDQPSEP